MTYLCRVKSWLTWHSLFGVNALGSDALLHASITVIHAIHVFDCINTCMHFKYMHSFMSFIHTFIHMHDMYVSMHSQLHVHAHIQNHCIYTYIYIYIYICICSSFFVLPSCHLFLFWQRCLPLLAEVEGTIKTREVKSLLPQKIINMFNVCCTCHICLCSCVCVVKCYVYFKVLDCGLCSDKIAEVLGGLSQEAARLVVACLLYIMWLCYVCSYYNVCVFDYLFVCVCVQFVAYQALDPEDYRGQAHDGPVDGGAIKVLVAKAAILVAIADCSAGLIFFMYVVVFVVDLCLVVDLCSCICCWFVIHLSRSHSELLLLEVCVRKCLQGLEVEVLSVQWLWGSCCICVCVNV